MCLIVPAPVALDESETLPKSNLFLNKTPCLYEIMGFFFILFFLDLTLLPLFLIENVLAPRDEKLSFRE